MDSAFGRGESAIDERPSRRHDRPDAEHARRTFKPRVSQAQSLRGVEGDPCPAVLPEGDLTRVSGNTIGMGEFRETVSDVSEASDLTDVASGVGSDRPCRPRSDSARDRGSDSCLWKRRRFHRHGSPRASWPWALWPSSRSCDRRRARALRDAACPRDSDRAHRGRSIRLRGRDFASWSWQAAIRAVPVS